MRAANLSAEAALAKLGEAAECIIGFINAFELQHSGNRAVIVEVSGGGHRVIYPTADGARLPDGALYASGNSDVGAGGDARALLSAAVRAAASTDAQRAPRVAAALARALCVVNRARGIAGGMQARGAAQMQARVLTVLAAPDDPAQYVPIMNCFFSAQRMKVPIDACVLGGVESKSTYFQQAAFLTKGVYFVPKEGALLQTLMTVFLPDQASREYLAMPVPGEVDFRASCFETRKVIDMGYTCSVCLSTFDNKNAAMCKVCGARFAVTQGRARRRPPTGR